MVLLVAPVSIIKHTLSSDKIKGKPVFDRPYVIGNSMSDLSNRVKVLMYIIYYTFSSYFLLYLIEYGVNISISLLADDVKNSITC